MFPMSYALQPLSVTSWILSVGCLWQGISATLGMRTVPSLTHLDQNKLPELDDGPLPHLSIIVPACNEETAIADTLLSLLASDGIRLEIIAVNDRSTDATGLRMEQIESGAAVWSPHRMQVIHVQDLPVGWLGKPHAMAMGLDAATAPWILFTDGDVHFEPGALQLCLRWALQQGADHAVVPPAQRMQGIGEAVMLAAMQVLTQWLLRIWKVSDPRARDSFGMGGFNLIRRQVLDSLGGMERLRMEVTEDLCLGKLVKRAGFAQRIGFAPGCMSIHWVQGWLGVVKLIEKNGFTIFGYNAALTLLACFGLLVDSVVPLLAAALGGWTSISALLTYLGIALAYHANRRFTGVSTWAVIGFAPAAALLSFSILRSMVLALSRGGIQWRGTVYSLADLRNSSGTR